MVAKAQARDAAVAHETRTVGAKISGGFKNAKGKVSAFFHSEKTKNFFNKALKVAEIAFLLFSAMTIAAMGAACLGLSIAATVIDPLCCLIIPVALTTFGLSLYASSLIGRIAIQEIKNF